jgi:serpin B
VHVDTRLVLANAIYLKGKWEDRFHQSLTKEGEFYRLDGSTVRHRAFHESRETSR